MDGFFDGGSSFTAQAYCVLIGQWKWQSSSNNPGLEDRKGTFGQVVNIERDGWSDPIDGAYLKELSQKHSITKVLPDFIKRKEMCDLIDILLIHSCLTVQVMHNYTTKKVLQLPAYKVEITNSCK